MGRGWRFRLKHHLNFSLSTVYSFTLYEGGPESRQTFFHIHSLVQVTKWMNIRKFVGLMLSSTWLSGETRVAQPVEDRGRS